MRAQAQEKLGKQAYALADYNSALWMQGLSEPTRSQSRRRPRPHLTKLGVATEAEKGSRGRSGEICACRSSAHTARTASIPAPRQAAATTQAGVPEVQTSGVRAAHRRHRQLFQRHVRLVGVEGRDGTRLNRTVRSRSRRSAAVVTETAPARKRRNSARESRARRRLRRRRRRLLRERLHRPRGNRQIRHPVCGAASRRQSDFRGRPRCKALSAEARRDAHPLSTSLATNDGGTLYKIIAEPYERGEGTAICELLKTKGLSCMMISR